MMSLAKPLIALYLMLIFSAASYSSENSSDILKVDRAKTLVAGHLIDPGSAIYTDVYIVSLPGGFGVCGLVNSKGPDKAYLGRKPFLVIENKVYVFTESKSLESGNAKIDETCLNRPVITVPISAQ